MIYLYKRNKTGICIDRVYGYDTIVELPDMLEGFPVTELGAYIFSDHIDSTELKMMQEKENFCTENGRATRPEDDMPQAAGNRVEEIRLPRQLRKIGRYAFYNCFHLKKLTFYGKMQDLGAGALTGCHRMEQIAVETDEKGESSLRDFLTELPETLCVDITIDGEYGRFWFPEFFEEGVENTPARILENHIHGSGLRYRNCFVRKNLNIREYDELFPYARAWEEEGVVLKMALGRLLNPVELGEKAEEQYFSHIQEHFAEAAWILMLSGEYANLGTLLARLKPEKALLEKLLVMAQEQKDTEAVSLFMDHLHKHTKVQRKVFEL